jgi:hypothetical protein
MYPLNDKDLDRLSRDAAEHYDVESSASGWERLESKLDKELPVKEKDRKRFLFWIFLIALLSGGALIYMLGGAPADNKLAAGAPDAGKVGSTPAAEVRVDDDDQPTENLSIIITEDKKTTNDDKDAATVSKSSTGHSTVTPANQAAAPSDKIAKTKIDHKAVTNDKTVAATRSSVKNNQPRRNNGKPVITNSPSQKGNTGVASNTRNKNSGDKKRNSKPAAGKADDAVVSNDVPVKDAAAKDAAGKDTPAKDVVVTDDRQKTTIPAEVKTESETATKEAETPKAENKTAETAAVKKTKTQYPSKKFSKWEFGITAGPDFSNVGFRNAYKTGWNIGAIVGYRFSNRLMINTGLIYTKKFYHVDGEDFYPPKHSYISYLDVNDVKGSCNMIEIPLNIRYDFKYNNRSRWFASTGISSYIMDKQDYDCYYTSMTGEEKIHPWGTDSNYNYFISNVNLSIGYERTLGRNFSIQAEPYLKLPLQGLGYGEIRMNSLGMLLTFKYKPSIKAKK